MSHKTPRPRESVFPLSVAILSGRHPDFEEALRARSDPLKVFEAFLMETGHEGSSDELDHFFMRSSGEGICSEELMLVCERFGIHPGDLLPPADEFPAGAYIRVIKQVALDPAYPNVDRLYAYQVLADIFHRAKAVRQDESHDGHRYLEEADIVVDYTTSHEQTSRQLNALTDTFKASEDHTVWTGRKIPLAGCDQIDLRAQALFGQAAPGLDQGAAARLDLLEASLEKNIHNITFKRVRHELNRVMNFPEAARHASSEIRDLDAAIDGLAGLIFKPDCAADIMDQIDNDYMDITDQRLVNPFWEGVRADLENDPVFFAGLSPDIDKRAFDLKGNLYSGRTMLDLFVELLKESRALYGQDQENELLAELHDTKTQLRDIRTWRESVDARTRVLPGCDIYYMLEDVDFREMKKLEKALLNGASRRETTPLIPG